MLDYMNRHGLAKISKQQLIDMLLNISRDTRPPLQTGFIEAPKQRPRIRTIGTIKAPLLARSKEKPKCTTKEFEDDIIPPPEFRDPGNTSTKDKAKNKARDFNKAKRQSSTQLHYLI